MYWQRAVYFPLVDHSATTESFLSTINYLVPAFNSGVQDTCTCTLYKLCISFIYETYKTDLSEQRDFDNEILRWQTKWSHLTDKKPVTITETLH